MRREFRTFIGVDLGGGKGKSTAVARLRLAQSTSRAGEKSPEVIVEDLGVHGPWYDEQLIEYLNRHSENAVLAIDAPLTLPACVRCVLPDCPSVNHCQVPIVAWFRKRRARQEDTTQSQRKPRYTPYTQRATEVLLHEDFGIMPRETLGQGMGPLTARMAYLRHALASTYRLNHNLLEVYPKATLAQLFPDSPPPAVPSPGKTPANGSFGSPRVLYKDGNGLAIALDHTRRRGGPNSQVARLYKRSGHALPTRARVLDELSDLRFGPGQWREFALQNDHQFDALICAYTAFLWTRDGWKLPGDEDAVLAEDGWIWFPPGPLPRKAE